MFQAVVAGGRQMMSNKHNFAGTLLAGGRETSARDLRLGWDGVVYGVVCSAQGSGGVVEESERQLRDAGGRRMGGDAEWREV